MSKDIIKECSKTLKIKNVGGDDRTPRMILKDGFDHLIQPYFIIMKKYKTRKQYQSHGVLVKSSQFIKKKTNQNRKF
jgi:hypothetical protein